MDDDPPRVDPELPDDMVAEAFRAYGRAHFKLEIANPTELELVGTRALIEALIDRGDMYLLRSRYPDEECMGCGRSTNHGIYVPRGSWDSASE